MTSERRGPLTGLRVVEFAAIGPVPLCGMLLADLGADVVVIERPDPGPIRRLVPDELQFADRGKRKVILDLKDRADRARALDLVAGAAVLVEGLRPGTMERLGLGPDAALARQPALVYARITGWGQAGPRAPTAGHDITYIALSGALHPLGRAGSAPVPPMNLIGDYAGGTMFGITGILAALLHARASGEGQVVDVAMVDGAAALLTPMFALRSAGLWRDERGVNLLDTGAPYYEVYRTKDAKYVAVGALEDAFFAALVDGLALDKDWIGRRHDRANWPALRTAIAAAIAGRTRAEWDAVFRETDACVAPVLAANELADEPHHRERGAFPAVDGHPQPAPAPRFGRTPAGPVSRPPTAATPVEQVLADWSA
jgi:alpha-methylacyl-CoA racemase